MIGSGTVRIVVMGLVLACLAGCLRPAERLTSAEADIACRYVEEIAHGGQGSPYELMRQDASDGMLRIANWAVGRLKGDRPVEHPRLLRTRADRWPLLRQGLARQVVRCRPDGLVELADQVSASDRDLFAPALRQENLDRVALTTILLDQGGVGPASERGQEMVARLSGLRCAHAAQAGGGRWPDASRSNSANGATTSTSTPAAGNGPAN